MVKVGFESGVLVGNGEGVTLGVDVRVGAVAETLLGAGATIEGCSVCRIQAIDVTASISKLITIHTRHIPDFHTTGLYKNHYGSFGTNPSGDPA